jgi:hypothetical protein
MRQNNIVNTQNDIAMKSVLKLFKGKTKTEDRPKITVQSVKPFTPEERERYNQWCKELNVSILWEDNRLRLG